MGKVARKMRRMVRMDTAAFVSECADGHGGKRDVRGLYLCTYVSREGYHTCGYCLCL